MSGYEQDLKLRHSYEGLYGHRFVLCLISIYLISSVNILPASNSWSHMANANSIISVLNAFECLFCGKTHVVGRKLGYGGKPKGN